MATDPVPGRRERLAVWLGAPVSPVPLVVFRVAFGLVLFLGAVRFVSKGWVETQYLEPDFHFTYFGFDWVRPLPGNWLYWVFALQMVAALLIAAGRAYRPAALAFFLSFTYVELLEKAAYLNHYYFVSLVAFLMIFLPLDRWGRLQVPSAFRTPGAGTQASAPRWVALALQTQIAMVYLFAGLAKLNPEWLLRGEPLGIWLGARSGVPLLGPLVDEPWLAYGMSWAGAAFDLSAPFLLWSRKTRAWAYLVVVAFHVTTAVLFPIGMFPWIMIASTLVFFPGPARGGVPAEGAERPPHPRVIPATGSPFRLLPRWAQGALAVFFLVQLAVPLRHLAYPGSVLWTEEGYRFSWRVMLVEKSGAVVFRATDPASGRSWEIHPSDHLTALQEKQMSFQPDMILEFAHFLRDARVAEGHPPPEIRADAFVSLNARPAERLLDPTVNLAAVPWDLAPKGWVTGRPPVSSF